MPRYNAPWPSACAPEVRFVSREATPNLISTDVAIIEDSWIVQWAALPGPGVLDLAEPEQEILFDGVQFARLRFEGAFKPAWFRHGHFEACIFPSDVTADALAASDNTVEDSVWLPRP